MSETLSHAIAQTCKAHRNNAERLLNQIGLHVGQEFILLELWRADGLTHSDLAERLSVQGATVTKMVGRMARAGLVERRGDLADQRVSRVYLTPEGRAKQAEVEAAWAQLEAVTAAGLSIEERLLLRRILLQVQANLHAHEPAG